MSFLDKFRSSDAKASTYIDPAYRKPPVELSFEDRMYRNLADEHYGLDLLKQASVTLETASAEQVLLSEEIDAEVRRLFGIKANVEVAAGRSAYASTSAADTVRLIDTPALREDDTENTSVGQ